jgi:hypothetical protein
MTDSTKVLTGKEKLALATKLFDEIEESGIKVGRLDGYDVLMILAQLLFPGLALDLRYCQPPRAF